MDNEIGSSVNLAIELIIISIIMSIVMAMTSMGVLMQRNILTNVENAYISTAVSSVREMEEYGTVPVATLYYELLKAESELRSLSGDVYGIHVTTVEDLKYLFHKKVKVSVTRNNDMLAVQIQEE